MARARHQNGWVAETGKKPKKWTGFYYEYVVEGGQERRKQRSRVLARKAGTSKAQAEEILRDFLRGHSSELKRPNPAFELSPPSSEVHTRVITFDEACERYLNLKQGYWAKHMRETMASIFRVHILPFLRDKPIAEIKPSDLTLWLNGRCEVACQDICRKCITHVRAVFSSLVDDGLLTKNPLHSKVKLGNVRERSNYFLELHECQALLEAASGWHYLAIELLVTLALRPSELFALRVNDVYPGRLRIDEAIVDGQVKGTKTRKSNGWVPLPPKLEDNLRSHMSTTGLHAPEKFLFPSETGTPFNAKNFLNRHLKPLGVKAGIQGGVNLLVLRRTCATHFADKHGRMKETQSLLRHTDASTAMKHYVKEIDQSLIDAVVSWEERLINQQESH